MKPFFVLPIAMITFMAFPFDMNAGDAGQTNVSTESDGKWVINHPDSRKIYAVQCGLDVTLFALKYFKVDYSLPRVSLGLPLSTDGISLADIQQMLQAYGLEAEARQGATIKQIAARLDGEYIAIIPLGLGNGKNHYYLGMMDDKGVIQLVNIGRGVSPLVRTDSQDYNDRIEKRFVEAGSVVLFVRKSIKKSDATSSVIKLFPEQIELGEFMIGGPEAAKDFSVSFELFNTSDRPVLVNSIQASCGCTKPEWDGGIIKPGAKQSVGFTVIPGAWGRGEQKKLPLVTTFADGSILSVTLHGTGQTPVERQRIELSQYSAIIEITDETPQPEFEVRLARLTSYVRPLNEITVNSDVSWLTAELREPEKSEHDESERAELYAKILTNDLLSLLSDDQRQRCVLDISGAGGMEPVTMSLEFFERDFFRLSQYFVTLPKSRTEPVIVQVTPEDANNPVGILEASADTPFLFVETDGLAEITIGFKEGVEIVPGYYSVTATIENARKRSSLAQMTIYVSSGDE